MFVSNSRDFKLPIGIASSGMSPLVANCFQTKLPDRKTSNSVFGLSHPSNETNANCLWVMTFADSKSFS